MKSWRGNNKTEQRLHFISPKLSIQSIQRRLNNQPRVALGDIKFCLIFHRLRYETTRLQSRIGEGWTVTERAAFSVEEVSLLALRVQSNHPLDPASGCTCIPVGSDGSKTLNQILVDFFVFLGMWASQPIKIRDFIARQLVSAQRWGGCSLFTVRDMLLVGVQPLRNRMEMMIFQKR